MILKGMPEENRVIYTYITKAKNERHNVMEHTAVKRLIIVHVPIYILCSYFKCKACTILVGTYHLPCHLPILIVFLAIVVDTYTVIMTINRIRATMPSS